MSTAGVLGVVAAAAYVSVKMLMRRRRPQRTAAVRQENRNRLILLIKEKDQVINDPDASSSDVPSQNYTTLHQLLPT